MQSIRVSLFILASSILISCGSQKNQTTNTTEDQPIAFYINLNDRSEDTFKVTIEVSGLSSENDIFQFASSAPGTYQIMDIGRFVRSFNAYDKNGESIETTQISTNQFELSTPEKIHTIQYHIAETFDTPVDEHPMYPMGGTSIEENHALINGQAVFGYFKGKQNTPITIKIDYPKNWIAGTALELNADNSYTANNYDRVVDSPILLGDLTTASVDVSGTSIDIFTYSEKGMITSEMILESLQDMVISADKFLNGLPVENYTFLFHFETNNLSPKGAWEHSYSSEYTLDEHPWQEIAQNVKDMASHEFFHIVTPLNIHSEVIHEFNFIKPVASRHLWLYEGTTEWASHMMQLRAGQKSIDDYLNILRRKAYFTFYHFDTNYSLLDLSLESFTEEGQQQYPNIYMKGALISGLLDIRLLELSNGKRGLIEVVNELAKTYGPTKPFQDDSFFEEFAKITHPEISEFIDLYIKKATLLPLKEYYQKIGIIYNEIDLTFVIDKNATKKQVRLRNHWMEQLK